MVTAFLPPPPSVHFRWRSLVFCPHHLSAVETNMHARFRWRSLVFRRRHPSIIENGRACSLVMVAAFFRPPPLKTSAQARFRWWTGGDGGFRWRPLVFRPHHPSTIENECAGSFSMAVPCFPPPPPLHHRKRACVLVFDGGGLFSGPTTPPPSKTSLCARALVSMAAACFPPSPPLDHRNRACALVFDDSLFFVYNIIYNIFSILITVPDGYKSRKTAL